MIGKTSMIVVSALFSTVAADWRHWDVYGFKGVTKGGKEGGFGELEYKELELHKRGKDGDWEKLHDDDDRYKHVKTAIRGTLEGNKKHGKGEFHYKRVHKGEHHMEEGKDDGKKMDMDYYPEDEGEEDDDDKRSTHEWKRDFCEVACLRTKECRESKFGSYCKPGNTKHDPDVCFGLYRRKHHTGERHRRYCFQPTDRRCNDHKLAPVKCHIKPRFTKFGGIIAFEKFLLHQDRY
jgi:hypothetical protein